jgi:NAD(P)-dependent dehydrogenase (short-subunit alcohol dehydrogenase family)
LKWVVCIEASHVRRVCQFRPEVEAQTPLGRTGQPQDIAPAAVFLASADTA